VCNVRFNFWLRFLGLLTVLVLAPAGRAPAQTPTVPAPEMAGIPQGSFLMGSEEGATWEQPVHQVEVSAFLIGTRPVTNGQFRAFQSDHKSPVNDADDAPVRAVSWEDAESYCQWLQDMTGLRYRLPTEAEWERAIRGGLEQKKYPWGDEPAVPESAVGNRASWPSGPANAFGLHVEYELWEWAADLYHRNYYQESPAVDPKGPAEGEFRVLRGGSYPNDPNSMRCSNRGSARPRTALPNVTFRVARDATPEQVSELRKSASPAQAARQEAAPQVAQSPAPQPQVPASQQAPPRQQVPAPREQPPVVATAARTPAAPPLEEAPAPRVQAPADERPATPAPQAARQPVERSPEPVPVKPATVEPSTAKPAPAVAASQPAAAAAGGGTVELTRVDATVSSVQVILALSLSGPAEYSTMELTAPDRLVIDLANTTVGTARRYGSLSVGDLGVEGVRWAPFEAANPTARLVIDLLQPVTFSIDAAPSGLVVQLRPR
jgi:formylglycine-generating enzyme required for sulfatase activity